MRKGFARLFALIFAVVSLTIAANAAPLLPIGYLSYDVTGTNLAEFDIGNLTGANRSAPGDPSAPVTTFVTFSDLSLTVYFTGGGSLILGPSYFTANSDGSLNGDQLLTIDLPPTGLLGADEAVLTGMFSTGMLTLNDGSSENVYTNFSTTLSDSGGLQDQDLAVINAYQTPEPATWTLLGTGLLPFLFTRVRRLNSFAKGSNVGIALSLGCGLLLLPGTMRAQSVKLSAVTIPSFGTAGTGSVSISGSGFPSGTITPATVSVTLSPSCGGSSTLATASAVNKVIGTTDKIAFAIPTVTAGTYFVAVSGTTSTNATFSSSNCATLTVLPGVSPVLTIDTTNPVDWIINNGALTIDYNSTTGAIWSIIPTGTQDQLVDFSPADPLDGETAIGGTPIPANWKGTTGTGQPATTEAKGFYMDLAGFTTVTPVASYSLTSSYLDFWVAYPVSGVAPTNTTEYEAHFVVTPNDPGIHLYFSVNHPAQVMNSSGTLVNNGAGTFGGQVQWIWRDSPIQFTKIYARDADLSMVNPVITPLPSVEDMFSSDPGREVQDVSGLSTIDLHPELGVTNGFSPYPFGQIPQGYSRKFYVKYDHASYEYLHKAHGLFGNTYGIWAVFPAGQDTMIGGPQKQNLNFTGGILTIEPLSDHFTFGLTMKSSGPGSTAIPAGTAMTRLFGPFYMRINKFGMATDSSIGGGSIGLPDDMYDDAVAAGASFTNFYANESVLLSKGYIPSTARGSVSVQAYGVTGVPRTAWAVLSQPGVNHQLSTGGYQYWADISRNGSANFTNVAPGTYRLSVYALGQWGEYRDDNVVVTAGNTTTVPTFTFVPEDFGTVIGKIGTPDRSCHEFLHGHSTTDNPDAPLGYDFRDYWGNWNYWADFATNPTNTVAPGAVVYNLTDGPNGLATNDVSKWNYTHWASYDPNLYGGAFNPSDDTTDGYTNLIPAYVNTLPGHTGTNGVTTPVPPWQVHFTTPAGALSQAYLDLSVALSTAQSTYTITINGGNPLAWTVSKLHASDASERSGLSGFTQWFVMQWPTSVLNPVGQDNVISINVSGTSNGYFEGSGSNAKAKVVANNSDDALRLELSNTGAQPSVTGWNDYEFVTSGTDTAANDGVPNP